MSAQIFPPEILHLFLDEFGSAIESPQSQERLDALLDIFNANPNIARHIRSFTVKHQIYYECLPAVFRQLCRLQEFRWMGRPTFSHTLTAITLSVSSICSDLPHLTVLHFENMMGFPLSLFSSCCHLESLTLVMVAFAKIRPETLSSSLFPSLKKLSISGPWTAGDEAVGIIMTHVAPTLTTLILSDLPENNAMFFLKLKSTIVFPVLETIQVSLTTHLYDQNSVPTLLSRFLEYSIPMLAQIQIEIFSPYSYTPLHIQHSLAKEILLPIDKILSSPRYRALKTLDLIFVPPLLSLDSLEVRMLLNEIFPAALSRNQTGMKVTPRYPQMPYDACIQVHFVF
ncbi:hypothetical protein BYT27DRAFT_7260544 [Phlegmacium glaucopus]|nr:hypothetical protein BYT27DRAFT_7260544 [Phlegmacium glaucopus]